MREIPEAQPAVSAAVGSGISCFFSPLSLVSEAEASESLCFIKLLALVSYSCGLYDKSSTLKSASEKSDQECSQVKYSKRHVDRNLKHVQLSIKVNKIPTNLEIQVKHNLFTTAEHRIRV